MEPKYFLLMAGDHYYPAGMEDWIDTFSTYEEANKRVSYNNNTLRSISKWIVLDKDNKEIFCDWYEIEDLREWINRE